MSTPPKPPPSLSDIAAKKKANAPDAKTAAVKAAKPAPSLAQLAAAGPQPKKKKSPGLFSQIGQVLEMGALLPVTLPNMIGHGIVHAGQFGYDYLQPNAKQDLGSRGDINRKYFPEATGLVNSARGTGGRVFNQLGLPTDQEFSSIVHNPTDVMHLPAGWKSNAAYYQDKMDKGEIVGTGVEDFGNIAMFASLGSSALGATGSWTAPLTASERAGVAGLADAELSGGAQRAATGIGPLEGGEVLKPQYVPGKGLAGYLERGQMLPGREPPGLATNGDFLNPVQSPATRVATAGRGLHQISAGADPLFRPLNAAGDLLEAGAGKAGMDISAFRPKNFVPKYGGQAVEHLAENTKVGKATLAGLTVAGRSISRELSSVRDTYQGDLLGATRQAMDPAMMAKNRFGMNDAQASAAMTIDNLFEPIMQSIRANPEGQAWLEGKPTKFDFDGLINRPYAGVATEGQRPTPDMIRELMNYESGATAKVDPHMAAAMDAVRESQRTVSGARSARKFGAGYVAGDEVQVGTREVTDPVTGEATTEPVMSTQYEKDKVNPPTDRPGNEADIVSPENYGNTLRPSVVLENQQLLQKVASKLGRDKEAKYAELVHEQRVNRALHVVVDELPPPPDVGTERNVGKYTEREATLRREHAAAVKEVDRAVDDYVKLSESETTPAAWAEAERRLDVATAKGEKIRERIEKLSRRRDATVALSRASGEIGPGIPRQALRPGEVADDLYADYHALQGDDALLVKSQIQGEIQRGIQTGQELSGQEAADFLAGLLPRHSAEDIHNLLVNNNVSWYELANYILNGVTTPSLRAIQEARTAAGNTQLGRYAGELAGLKSALPGIGREEDAAIASLSRAADAGERAQAKAAEKITVAQSREAWLASKREVAAGKIPTNASEVRNPWRRYESADGEVHASKAERQQQLLGASNARLARVEREYRNVSRSYDRAQWKVGNVPTELGRKFQVRLVEDVNGPVLNRADSAAGKGIKNFGEVKGLSGMGGTGKAIDPYVNGMVGTLASKYGVSNELLDSIHAHMTQKAEQLGLDMADKATWTNPHVQLEPVELAQAFHDAMDVGGKTLENWESIQLHDSMHSAQMRLGMRGVIEANGLQVKDRAPIVDTSGTGTEVPGGADYQPRSNGEVWTGDSGKAMQAPFAVLEYMNDYMKDQWNAPQEVRNAVDDVRRGHLDNRNRFLQRKMDEQARAIPAPFRGIHQIAKLHIADLLEQATKLNEAKPGSGDVYAELAWDVSSGLDEMVQAGLSPQHMIGGAELDPTGRSGSGRTSGIGGRRKPKAAQLKTTGFRETGIEAYARVEAKDLRDWLVRRRDHVITDAFAKRATQIPALQAKIDEARATGRDMSGADIKAHAKEQGWVPLHEGQPVTADSQFLPQRVDQSMRFDAFFDSDNPVAKGFQGLHWVNSQWKQFLLGLSPKWVMGNVFGMTLAATVHGGLGPGEFVRAMRRNVTAQGGLGEVWRNEGLLPELPGQLSAGLTSGEMKIAYDTKLGELDRRRFDPRRGTDAIKNVTYPGNEVFDNLSKSTLYLSKLAEGQPREAALKSTLDAMGNYNAMSTLERRIVREIIPFYAWMRQSSKVMLRLPYVSPMRAAMVYSIGTAMMDPDITTDVMQVIGSRFQLGAGSNTFLDMGSFNPNADFTGSAITAFDPRNIGQALSPGLRFPIKALFGVDPATWGMQSRPNDTYNTELYGQKGATPSWSRLLSDPGGALKETLWDVKNLTPLTRNLADLAYGNEARYAGTGYPIANLPKNPNITLPRTLLKAAQLPSLYTSTSPQVRSFTAAQRPKKKKG